jgi:hypothetical protein
MVPAMTDATGLSLLFWAIGLFVLYLVIRVAVRHAIQDADERRGKDGT